MVQISMVLFYDTYLNFFPLFLLFKSFICIFTYVISMKDNDYDRILIKVD